MSLATLIGWQEYLYPLVSFAMLCDVRCCIEAALTSILNADAVTLETESVRRRLHDVGTGGPNDATLAETVVMINGLIAQTYEGKGTEDFEGVLTRWAQLAFAAEGQFATLAGELGAGNTTAEAYTYAFPPLPLLVVCTCTVSSLLHFCTVVEGQKTAGRNAHAFAQ